MSKVTICDICGEVITKEDSVRVNERRSNLLSTNYYSLDLHAECWKSLKALVAKRRKAEAERREGERANV